jgi:endoglucanase
MDNTLVYQLNQAAIDGIRAAGATSQYIFVEGNSWTGAWHWVCLERIVYILTTLADFMIELKRHCYGYGQADGSI